LTKGVNIIITTGAACGVSQSLKGGKWDGCLPAWLTIRSD